MSEPAVQRWRRRPVASRRVYVCRRSRQRRFSNMAAVVANGRPSRGGNSHRPTSSRCQTARHPPAANRSAQQNKTRQPSGRYWPRYKPINRNIREIAVRDQSRIRLNGIASRSPSAALQVEHDVMPTKDRPKRRADGHSERPAGPNSGTDVPIHQTKGCHHVHKFEIGVTGLPASTRMARRKAARLQGRSKRQLTCVTANDASRRHDHLRRRKRPHGIKARRMSFTQGSRAAARQL